MFVELNRISDYPQVISKDIFFKEKRWKKIQGEELWQMFQFIQK